MEAPWHALVLIGFALTATFVSLTEHAVGDAPDSIRGVTSGLFETSTHLGGALAVATCATLLTRGSHVHAYLAGAALTGGGTLNTGLLFASAARQLCFCGPSTGQCSDCDGRCASPAKQRV